MFVYEIRIFLVWLLIILIACKKNDSLDLPVKDQLTTDSTTLNFNTETSVDSFNVNYSGNWTITFDPATTTWLKCSRANGKGNTKVYVTIQESNNTDSSRKVFIIITPDDKPLQAMKIAVTQSHAAAKNWKQIAPFPGMGRGAATSFTIGDKMYVGLGLGIKNNSLQELNDFYEYNATANTWVQKNDFPGGARQFAGSFIINDQAYVAFGINTTSSSYTYYKDIWKYDAPADTWTKVTEFDDLPDGQIAGSSIFVLDSKAYIQLFDKMYMFDPVLLTLTERAPYPKPATNAASFVINGKAYVGTGDHQTPPFVSKDFYEYDPASDKWTQKADLPGKARRNATGLAVNGKGYIIAGEIAEETTPGTFMKNGTNEAWEYDAATNVWKQLKDYAGAKLYKAAGGVVSGKIIVGTGEAYYHDPQFLNEFWAY